MKWLQRRREAAAMRRLSHQLLELHKAKRLALLTAFVKLIEKDGGGTDSQSQRIASFAVNIMTGQQHDPVLFAELSEADREYASSIAEAALPYEMLATTAAHAARFLAMAHYQVELDMDTFTLTPKAADYILALARRATELAPNDSHCFSTLAQIYTTLKEDDEAYSAACRAVELDFDNPEALRILANSELCRARYDQAARLIERAQELRPSLQGLDGALAVIRDVRAGQCNDAEAAARARRL